MTRCLYCRADVSDLADHYAGDECRGLVAALGPVTPAGKRAEMNRRKGVKAALDAMEGAAVHQEKRDLIRQRVFEKERRRIWERENPSPCDPSLSDPVEHRREICRRYYLKHRDELLAQAKEKWKAEHAAQRR